MIKTISTLVILAALVSPVFGGVIERVTADVKTGTVVIALNDTVTDALDLAEVIFKKAQPARIKPGKGELTFVVSGGAIDLSNGQSEIIASGGITLAKEVPPGPIETFAVKVPKQFKTVTILDPIVDLSDLNADVVTKKISATIVVNGASLGRLEAFTIDGTVFSGLGVILPKNRKISAKNLSLKLTAEAATALNEALGVPLFTGDTEIGTVDLNVTTASSKL
jgi:hypothetical protein